MALSSEPQQEVAEAEREIRGTRGKRRGKGEKKKKEERDRTGYCICISACKGLCERSVQVRYAKRGFWELRGRRGRGGKKRC